MKKNINDVTELFEEHNSKQIIKNLFDAIEDSSYQAGNGLLTWIYLFNEITLAEKSTHKNQTP